jgi:hypothetical protein
MICDRENHETVSQTSTATSEYYANFWGYTSNIIVNECDVMTAILKVWHISY